AEQDWVPLGQLPSVAISPRGLPLGFLPQQTTALGRPHVDFFTSSRIATSLQSPLMPASSSAWLASFTNCSRCVARSHTGPTAASRGPRSEHCALRTVRLALAVSVMLPSVPVNVTTNVPFCLCLFRLGKSIVAVAGGPPSMWTAPAIVQVASGGP